MPECPRCHGRQTVGNGFTRNGRRQHRRNGCRRFVENPRKRRVGDGCRAAADGLPAERPGLAGTAPAVGVGLARLCACRDEVFARTPRRVEPPPAKKGTPASAEPAVRRAADRRGRQGRPAAGAGRDGRGHAAGGGGPRRRPHRRGRPRRCGNWSPRSPAGERRCTPTRGPPTRTFPPARTSCRRRAGRPAGKGAGTTSRPERFGCTLRQRCSRSVRQTRGTGASSNLGRRSAAVILAGRVRTGRRRFPRLRPTEMRTRTATPPRRESPGS